MLVLARKTGEIVMVGDIAVMVVDIRGDKVRLGVDAPQCVPIHRKEVYDAIYRNSGGSEDGSGAGQPTPSAG